MIASELVHQARAHANLSVRALAQASGVAASTIHRIEQGELNPTVAMLERIVEASGMRLHIEAQDDYAASVLGLARSIHKDINRGDTSSPVRKAAELAHRFHHAEGHTRHRMIAAEPPTTGDARWDAFVAALAEWLAVQAGDHVPQWARDDTRYLHRGWWVTPMKAVHAWEYAGTPASFQHRGVYIHRDSLTNV
ncbi:MAG: helix-turn-helix domain-containing protein [Acidimicrobiales bacterium]